MADRTTVVESKIKFEKEGNEIVGVTERENANRLGHASNNHEPEKLTNSVLIMYEKSLNEKYCKTTTTDHSKETNEALLCKKTF